MTPDEIEGEVTVSGWENLTRALDLGRGAILFAPHVGNVDIVLQVAVIRGIPTVGPVERTEPERLFRYTRSIRESHGVKLIPSDGPMLGLFRALRRGEVVGLAADRDTTASGRMIDFFGAPARMPEGTVRVAMLSGAPLLSACASRQPDDSILMEIGPPLELPQTGDQEADLQAGVEMVAATIERHIAKYPDQWLVAVQIWPDP
jgi:KDO2-lipid IV(A) lauroyltransferase